MFSSVDIGIDLGTANVLVYIKGKGIVLDIPSVVAFEKDTNKIIAMGHEAKEMLGRTPENISVIHPLSDGVIADYGRTEAMLQYLINNLAGKSLIFKPRIMICVPTGVTGVEQRAVLEVALQAGASKTFIIEEPLAAALGAGIDISQACGHMIVDIGGGTLDAAVLSLGGIVESESLRIGSNYFDEAIIRYVRKQHSVLIGESTAEKVKLNIATVYKGHLNESMDIRGRDLISGLPKLITITSEEIYPSLLEVADVMVASVRSLLERTPPELSSDIIDKGIMLTGGGALLNGLDKLLQESTKITVHIAEDALSCVALGTGKALESLGTLEAKLTALKKVDLNR